MMTRKFYRILAGNIQDNYQHDLQKYPNPVEAEQRRESAMRIAIRSCKADNPKFNESTFRKACTSTDP